MRNSIGDVLLLPFDIVPIHWNGSRPRNREIRQQMWYVSMVFSFTGSLSGPLVQSVVLITRHSEYAVNFTCSSAIMYSEVDSAVVG